MDKQPSSKAHSPRASRISGLIDDHRTVAHVVDEDPLLDADLRRRQAEPRRLVHGGEHVLGQPGDLAVDVGDLSGSLAEHGVADDADLVGRGHARQGTGRLPPWESLRGSTSRRSRGPDGPLVGAPRPPGRLVHPRHRPRRVRGRPGGPGTKYLLLEALRRAPAAPSSTSGAGTARSPAPSPPACPVATVWAVDVNRRALDLCRQNAAAPGLTNVTAVEPTPYPMTWRSTSSGRTLRSASASRRCTPC